jgi:hypothetical protein
MIDGLTVARSPYASPQRSMTPGRKLLVTIEEAAASRRAMAGASGWRMLRANDRLLEFREAK